MQTLMVIAGEASGDLHGGEILREIKALNPGLRIIGVGGRHITPHLDKKLGDIADLGVVGLVEPLLKLPMLFALRRTLIRCAMEEGVTDLLTLDYPGFNMSIARTMKSRLPAIRLHHYVCPQVWAWKAGRIPKLGKLLDTLYCLFDFEPGLFKGLPVDARFVGNPLVEVVKPEMDRDAFLALAGLDGARPIAALLPGSREGELERLLPPMAQMVKAWDKDSTATPLHWVLPLAPTLSLEKTRKMIEGTPIRLIQGHSYAARSFAAAALVCSGTATLETALLGTPFAILYRMNPITLALARRLVKVPWFGLANVVAGKEVARELLQEEVHPAKLAEELKRLLDPAVAEPMREELLQIRQKLGEPGAAARVAKHLVELL